MDSITHRQPEPFHDAFFRCLLANSDVADRLSLKAEVYPQMGVIRFA